MERYQHFSSREDDQMMLMMNGTVESELMLKRFSNITMNDLNDSYMIQEAPI